MIAPPPIQAPWVVDAKGMLRSEIWIQWLTKLASSASSGTTTTTTGGTTTTVVNHTTTLTLSAEQLAALNSRIDQLALYVDMGGGDADSIDSNFTDIVTSLSITDTYARMSEVPDSGQAARDVAAKTLDSEIFTWMSF